MPPWEEDEDSEDEDEVWFDFFRVACNDFHDILFFEDLWKPRYIEDGGDDNTCPRQRLFGKGSIVGPTNRRISIFDNAGLGAPPPECGGHFKPPVSK